MASIDKSNLEAKSDKLLIDEAKELLRDDKLLCALRLIRKVQDTTLFDDEIKDGIHLAELCEKSTNELLSDPNNVESGWKKQGESHGHRDFVVYYKIEDGDKLKIRIDSPIEQSLYVPFLAVMNETDLYETWIPKWKFPFHFSIDKSVKLQQKGRVNQIVQLRVNVPWPLKKREAILHGFAYEDIDVSKQSGLKIMSITNNNNDNDDNVIPELENNIKRLDLDAGLLFQPCPTDHPVLQKSKVNYPKNEKLVLLSFSMYVDPKIALIPHAFLNFCARTVFGGIWKMILRTAEEVRDGKRPVHTELIEAKREVLYNWVDERSNQMLK